ncbi:hypothetical protein [Streptococcus pacificus]|uniref:Uncharacterized protein n=1 Tax=Streptococcus pacificus TaxID=2740577 RepID=A0ABS0ZGW9_9STRE|nr:hypothetical protein [Streptococcus pacificus]MBJ8325251.1 hypothetical protein [Streptococcus pacificus]
MRNFEKDSDLDAWRSYLINYRFLENPTIKNFKSVGNRLFYKYKNNKEVEITLSGDCSFNFNEKKKKLFEDIIRHYEDKTGVKQSDTRNKLLACCSNHHQECNFALMPVVGGMNNVKGKIKISNGKVKVHQLGRQPNNLFDRLDSFLSLLNEFYNFRKKCNEFNCSLKEIGEYYSESIFLESLKSENFTILYDFLEKFTDINEYVETFYPWIKEDFLIKLLKSGADDIETIEDLEKYMTLAQEYWQLYDDYNKKVKDTKDVEGIIEAIKKELKLS